LKDHKYKKSITRRPADYLEPELDKAKEAVKDISTDLKDVLIYALYPTTGLQFLEWKYGIKEPPPEVCAKSLAECEWEEEMAEKARKGLLVEPPKKQAPEKSAATREFNVYVDGEYFQVEVDPAGRAAAVVSAGQAPAPPQKAPAAKPAPAPPAWPPAARPAAAGSPGEVAAPMPGIVIEYRVKKGDQVKAGDVLLILEAMKMQNEIKAPASGKVSTINFSAGDSVQKGDVLLVIES